MVAGDTALHIAIAAKGLCDVGPALTALTSGRQRDVAVHIAHDQPLDIAPQNGVFLHPCPPGTSIVRLWGKALAQASTGYVAVLDAHCPPGSGWLDEVCKAIEEGLRIFYGPVGSAWSPNDPRIVGYLCEYAQFHAPLPADLDEVPGNNLVFHASLLAPAEELSATGFYKTFLIHGLQAKSADPPVGIDAMAVTYCKGSVLRRYLRRRWVHGRCYAARRHELPGQPPRWLCLAFTPALPALRLWRIFRGLRGNEALLGAFIRHLASVVLSEIAWSWGEMQGYAFGSGGLEGELD